MTPNSPNGQDSASILESAVIIDQWELFRIGIERVLSNVDLHVVSSVARLADGMQAVRDHSVDVLIVGKCTDLNYKLLLNERKTLKAPINIILLLDAARSEGLARLLSLGADALLMRTTKANELEEAVQRVMKGERFIAPALAATSIGVIGPMVGLDSRKAQQVSGLSPKEVEVLGVLGEGGTYKEMAETLIVTQATVKTHLVHIYAKLGVRNKEQAIAKALALGLLG